MTGEHRVLVVDDDPIFVRTTIALLKSHGYQVDHADEQSKALVKMREQLPDLVLLDVMMSWLLEGVSISREMMGDAELRSIPIIMLTSIRDSEHVGIFPQDEYLHIDSWLDKPCPPNRLLSEIEAAISRREQYKNQSRDR